MANLIITQVPLGLRILTDTSDAVFNEFSVKRNNLSTDEIEIISDNKNNYAIFKIDFSTYTAVSFDGTVITTVGSLYTKLINVVSYSSPQSIDEISGAINTVDYSHHEIHEGDAYDIIYSVASLGAMTSPDDTITLTFKTSNTTEWIHFTFAVFGTSGWLVKLVEAPTGGAASPTGALPIYNKNRNSSNTSTVSDGTTSGQVSYDATLATGGITLWNQYLEGSSGPKSAGASANARNEIVLKQNTTYQLSLYGTATDPATLIMDWYEHTNL